MAKIKAFHFKFDGKYLGGHIVVTSITEANAWAIARERISLMELDQTTIELHKIIPLGPSTVVYEWNGDY